MSPFQDLVGGGVAFPGRCPGLSDVAPSGLDGWGPRVPRALPWAIPCRPFRAYEPSGHTRGSRGRAPCARERPLPSYAAGEGGSRGRSGAGVRRVRREVMRGREAAVAWGRASIVGSPTSGGLPRVGLLAGIQACPERSRMGRRRPRLWRPGAKANRARFFGQLQPLVRSATSSWPSRAPSFDLAAQPVSFSGGPFPS